MALPVSSRMAGGVVAVLGIAGLALLGSAIADTPSPAPTVAPSVPASARSEMLLQYCSGCHNDRLKTAGLSVQSLHADDLAANDEAWEKILHRLNLGEMPPKGVRKPPKEYIADFTQWLSGSLDAMAAAHPDPGRATVRRMNRVEYANAVRDLLALDIDVANELPVDDIGYGFDNIADVLTVSPTLIDRYIRVAGKISRLATGIASREPVTADRKIDKDLFENGFGVASFNERADDELPLNSRGGGVFKFYAPYDATYKIQLYLNSGTSTEAEIDAANRYEISVPLKAGLRVIGASFPKRLALDEHLVEKSIAGPKPVSAGKAVPLPLDIQVDGVRIRRITVPSAASGINVSQDFYLRDVMQISVAGPYDIQGAGLTPSRKRIFTCRPSAAMAEDACTRKILTTLAHRAYRRPVTAADIAPLMKIFREERRDGDFDHGIAAALQAVLVSPEFLFMRQTDPKGSAAGSVHRISDLELATRLSFFLWSSIPDDALLSAAEQGRLHNPAILARQVSRMLADPRAMALTQNFAGQWLYLRRLEYQKPDRRIFPDFDQRLRSAMLAETQTFFASMVRDNRSILDLLDADYTFVNQRLAEHYGIPGVYGTTLRRVALDPALHRGGLLGQGSILTVTSYNNRTSVVLRGKWILENLLAAAPPPPPPNIPALNDEKNGRNLTVRQQMEVHRANPVCASCHSKMDPLGFSLENYDATGKWRIAYAGQKVDASAVLPDGTAFEGPKGLQGILMAHKDQFVEAFIERLMTYALGRGVEAYDMPAVRAIRAQAERDNYRVHSIVMGIIKSTPFVMRRTPDK